MRTSYPTDLTDSQWQMLEPLLHQHKLGRPRIVDLREVINAILYVLCTGCGWEYLPHDFPKCKTVYYYCASRRDDGSWTAIHEQLRSWTRAKEKRGFDFVWFRNAGLWKGSLVGFVGVVASVAIMSVNLSLLNLGFTLPRFACF